jgi:hypothetical protein
MGDLLWVLPALGCGLMMAMMVVMMFGMGKSMFSRGKQDEAREGRSLEELRAEQERMAEEIARLEARDGTHGRTPSATGG